jgi:hypothetical protein
LEAFVVLSGEVAFHDIGDAPRAVVLVDRDEIAFL